MTKLIPVPSIESVPAALVDSEGIVPFTDMLDDQFQASFNETAGLKDMKDPLRVPSVGLAGLGEMLSTDLLPDDSDEVKRRKVANATAANRERSLWTPMKVIIDAMVGADATLVNSLGDDDFVLAPDDTDAFYWAGIGGADALAAYGIRIVGGGSDGVEGVIKGEILVDVGRDDLTAAEIAALVEGVRRSCPAFFEVYLGYMDGGAFVPYAGGMVG